MLTEQLQTAAHQLQVFEDICSVCVYVCVCVCVCVCKLEHMPKELTLPEDCPFFSCAPSMQEDWEVGPL